MNITDLTDAYFIILLISAILYSLVLTYLKKGFNSSNNNRSTRMPAISIIVSMHNEEHNVKDCLECLISQDYPTSKLEIIIVNDRSSDRTAEFIKEYTGKYPIIKYLHVKTFHEDFAPKKYAIDKAVGEATGEIILLTDADGRPFKSWARQMVACFTEQIGMVIGYAPYTTEPPCDRYRYKLLALEYLSHAAIAAASTGLNYPLTCVGTNMAYRKQVYLELGGFGIYKHIHSGDDDLFLQQVRQETNWKIRYAHGKDSLVYNAPPLSLIKFIQQRIRYASKGFQYPVQVTVGLILYFIWNLLLLGSPFIAIINGIYLPVLILILMLKGFSEYNFLNTAQKFFQSKERLKVFPIASLLHIPYVVFFGLVAQLKSFEWGGHKS